MRQFELVTEDIRFEHISLVQGDLKVDDCTNKYQTFLILVGIAVVAMWYHLAEAKRAIRRIETKENNN